jgi:DNA polymerase III, subunit gamma and tau
LGVVPDIVLNQFLELISFSDKIQLLEFIDKIWEDGIVIETFLKDFAYYLKEQFKTNKKLSVNFILKTISSIFFILNEFKYEDDKRLLGYVLIHELYKDVNGNEKSSKSVNGPLIHNVTKRDTGDDVKAIKNENSSVVENTENNSITHLNNSIENQLEFIEIDNTGDLIENSDYENLTGKIENDKSEMTLSEKINNPSEYSVDLFEKNWEKIRKEIKNTGAILNALMADTYPEEIKNGVLVIRFPDGHKFHSRQIMELDKKSKIEAIINKICNTDIKITTIFDNDARENSDDEFIEKVINFFDGEIIEKK